MSPLLLDKKSTVLEAIFLCIIYFFTLQIVLCLYTIASASYFQGFPFFVSKKNRFLNMSSRTGFIGVWLSDTGPCARKCPILADHLDGTVLKFLVLLSLKLCFVGAV